MCEVWESNRGLSLCDIDQSMSNAEEYKMEKPRKGECGMGGTKNVMMCAVVFSQECWIEILIEMEMTEIRSKYRKCHEPHPVGLCGVCFIA